MKPLMEPLPSAADALDSLPLALYHRHLGLPAETTLDGRLFDLAEQARRWYQANCQPWQTAIRIAIHRINGSAIELDQSVTLRSELLAAGLAQAKAHTLIVVAATAGEDVDQQIHQLWQSERPDEAMFLNAYAIALVEQLRANAADQLRKFYEARGQVVLPHYSPGYDGWDLSDHAPLLQVLSVHGRENQLPVHLLESGGLRPAKSIVAVYGITDETSYANATSDFWTRVSTTSCEPTRPAFQYAFTEKALKLWCDRRLQLRISGDREVTAKFRFDGSTCNNMGVPLAFDYQVRLTRDAGSGYRIAESSCRPAEGDVGFRSTCAFMEDPVAHAAQINEYHPLLGRLLREALDWNPPVSPAGCLCTQPSQDHKWRIVLQTIHFALVNQ